jgi:hypothetical protein
MQHGALQLQPTPSKPVPATFSATVLLVPEPKFFYPRKAYRFGVGVCLGLPCSLGRNENLESNRKLIGVREVSEAFPRRLPKSFYRIARTVGGSRWEFPPLDLLRSASSQYLVAPEVNRHHPFCCLCGKSEIEIGEQLTKDHVIADCFFPQPKPANLLTLPCCVPCQTFRLNPLGRQRP